MTSNGRHLNGLPWIQRGIQDVLHLPVTSLARTQPVLFSFLSKKCIDNPAAPTGYS